MATKFIGYTHKPVDVTDDRTGAVKHFDKLKLYFVTDRQPDCFGLYGFQYSIEFADMLKVTGCNTEGELMKKVETQAPCFCETIVKGTLAQLIEIHWDK